MDYQYTVSIPNGDLDVFYGTVFYYDDNYKEAPVINYNYYAVGVNWLMITEQVFL